MLCCYRLGFYHAAAGQAGGQSGIPRSNACKGRRRVKTSSRIHGSSAAARRTCSRLHRKDEGAPATAAAGSMRPCHQRRHVPGACLPLHGAPAPVSLSFECLLLVLLLSFRCLPLVQSSCPVTLCLVVPCLGAAAFVSCGLAGRCCAHACNLPPPPPFWNPTVKTPNPPAPKTKLGPPQAPTGAVSPRALSFGTMYSSYEPPSASLQMSSALSAGLYCSVLGPCGAGRGGAAWLGEQRALCQRV